MARLVVSPGSPAAWEIQLNPGANSIGRGDTNDFRIPDPSVSGSHCELVVAGGTVSIRDLRSTNGTFVNGHPVAEAVLQTGQQIRLGRVELVFYGDPGSPAAAKPGKPAPIKVTVVPTAVAPSTGPAVRTTISQTHAPLAVPEPPPPLAAPVQPVATSLGPPPPARPDTGGEAAPPGEGLCQFHTKTQGRFLCRQCRHFFCELCVVSRMVDGAQRKFCRHCGVECIVIQLKQAPKRRTEKGFFGRLPGAFAYPLCGSGLLMLIGGAVVLSALKFFAWGLILNLLFLGYLFSYLQSIIHSTAAEEPEVPPLPGLSNFWEDIIQPSLKFLGLVLFCWGPALLLGILTASSEESFLANLIFPATVLGGIYFPMAFLAVAILDSVAAANPLQVIPSIFKVPLEYLVTLILLSGVWGLRSLGDLVLPILFPRGLITYSMPKLAAFLAAQGFWSLAGLYLLTVSVRILGLLYVTRKEKLGWLSH